MTTETQGTQETATIPNTSSDVTKETGESSTTTTTNVPKGESTERDKHNPDTKDKDKDSRFGVSGKPATKISFRILTNLSLSFKPYCGLNSDKLCIKPGGLENAVKPFTSTVGSKQYKKVGIRITYSIKQLLSIRDKCKALPSDVEQIAGVFEEGLGDFETLTDQTITLQTSAMSRSDTVTSASKLRKTTSDASSSSTLSTTTTLTTTTTTTSAPSTIVQPAVPDARDQAASFRDKGMVTPSQVVPLAARSKLSQRHSLNVNKSAAGTGGGGGGEQQQTATAPTKSKASKDAMASKASIDEITQHMATTTTTTTTTTAAAATAKKTSSAVPLSSRTARSAWGRGAKQLDPMARLTAKITVRLNKITLDNFDTLSHQIIEIFESDIVNTEQLTRLVSLIFEKTVQEHVYGPLYAQLCVALAGKNKSFEEAAFEADGRAVVKQVDFKTVLVKVCQSEFSKGKRAAVFTDEMDETDRGNEVIKQKNILLGTMKFIGQLYLKELLPAQIMTVCLRHLVSGAHRPSEDDLEGACTLLRTVGRGLDADAAINKGELSKYYNRLKSVEKNSREYSVRIRMLIQNLLHLRRSNWHDVNAAAAASKTAAAGGGGGGGASGGAASSSTTAGGNLYDADDPFGIFDVDRLDAFVRGVNDVSSEIMAAVPVPGHLVAVGAGSQRMKKTRINNRYISSASSGSGAFDTSTPLHLTPQQQQQQNMRKSRSSSGSGGGGSGGSGGSGSSGGGRRLLQTAEEQEIMMFDAVDEVYEGDSAHDEKQQSATTTTTTTTSTMSVGIGERKNRLSLASNSQRPCDSGKSLDDEQLDEFMGDFLHLRNDMNESKMLDTLKRYRLSNRVQFMHKFVQQAIDGGKGERLANFIPKLLDAYIVVADELDGGLVDFFKGYTFEDNPQLARNTSQLLAPLIVDNEIAFDGVLRWVLLDTRQHQEAEMLKFYDGDGVRNYASKNSDTMTIVLVLLAELLKELRDACFEDSEYVRKLLSKYRFSIDEYINQKDVGKRAQIQQEWVKTYGLQFAF